MCVCALSHVWLFVAPGLYLPGSSIHRISQAKILERVDISYSRRSSHPLDRTCIFCVSCIAGGFFTTVLPFLFSRSGQIYWISNKQTGDGPATKTVLWISLVQLLSRVWLFVTPWTAARQDSLSITKSRRLLKLIFIDLLLPSNHLILCHPHLILPSVFPRIESGSFPTSQFFP